jgi:hypothetical protein
MCRRKFTRRCKNSFGNRRLLFQLAHWKVGQERETPRRVTNTNRIDRHADEAFEQA